jgi:hypothetical protein
MAPRCWLGDLNLGLHGSHEVESCALIDARTWDMYDYEGLKWQLCFSC